MSRRKKAAPEVPTTGKVARQASREKLAEEARTAVLPAQARLLLRWLEEPLETVKVRGRHSYQLQLTMTIAPDRLPSGLDLSLREAKKAGEFLAGLRLAVFELRQGLLHIMTAEVDDRIKSGELAWSPRDGRLTDARLVEMEAAGVWAREAEARLAKAERENPSPGERIGFNGLDLPRKFFIEYAPPTESEIEERERGTRKAG